MIEREHRFHGYNSLRFVYKNGQTVRNDQVALRYIKNNRSKSWRAAVVVSRKVSKSAVVRNKIRRRIYELIRLDAKSINLPYDLVILVYSPQISEIEFTKLNEIILDLFERAKISSKKLPHTETARHDIVDPKEE